ncbi:MAG TPA: EamA family transporter RarD [Bacillus sp. (in: firmicutes)]|uniref:EamA family transporter RarD n=1 Tax=Bacillus litorisediminis TaxID=2922713 RepID=UPI001FAD6361|nr:EamA family transporter RarD [Bacillus litorisediminis]HWO75474.1 EamA family transporter RarD [Bacillus sp. (in: firmicutes)]
MNQEEKKGIIYAASSYVVWGFLPLYWKWLDHVGSYEILAHRIIWSFIFMVGFLAVTKSFKKIRETLTYLAEDKKRIAVLVSASALITVNWLLYIYAVNSDHIVQTSLGYYINPLVSVLLGIVFLKESLKKLEVFSLFLALAGVLVMTISYGHIPWLALGLALSFGVYGLLKKIVKLESSVGLMLETFIMLPFAFIFVIGLTAEQQSSFLQADVPTTILMIGSGAATAIPLLWFAMGTQRIPLNLIGFLQYIAPSLMLLIGVFLYHEPFTVTDQLGFAFIWSALILFTFSKMKKPHARNRFKEKEQQVQA